MKYIKLFDTHLEYLEWKSDCNNYVVPNVAACIDSNETHFNEQFNYLTFVPTESSGNIGIIQVEHPTFGIEIEYSLDNGATWTYYDLNYKIPYEELKPIKFRGLNNSFNDADGYYCFSIDATCYCYGDVNTLLNNVGGDIRLEPFCFSHLFENCKIITPPELPSTQLAEGCYQNMFAGCASLTTAPELPATTLADNCYSSMFRGCTSLTTAPNLPATQLAVKCYGNMFSRCESLTTAPNLPATHLAGGCYNGMFHGCRSLTSAPELPAIQLADNCYREMFVMCSSLTYIKCLSLDELGSRYSENWVTDVGNNGAFYINSGAPFNSIESTSIKPYNWAVVYLDV